MEFHPGSIHDVLWRPLRKFTDARGWLCELFRHDELPPEFHPVMAYISMTEPGVARGPHEHVDQSDCFCFLGPSLFQVFLWDARQQSPTYLTFQTATVGEDQPMLLVVPPGVVHAYKNVGGTEGIVYNFPNRLYRGPGRRDPIDEIRHEDKSDTPFRLE
jgi:dTDP-4-dehydrorhamnose 3,5-epimerase